MKVTLKEIAKSMGVSIGTVSNALNNKGKISPEKRKKIIETAREMGYPVEKKLKINRERLSGKIGVVFPSHSNAKAQNYYIAEVLAGVEEQIKSAGFSLMIESYNDDMPDLTKQNLDGLMLIGGQFPESFVLKLSAGDCPLVTIGTYSIKAPINAVVADNQMGAYQATTHLLELGHRDIGFINGPETTGSSRSKYEGFREALIAYGQSPDPSWITSANFTIEDGYEAAKKFLAMRRRPTAMFIADDPIAIGAIKAFQEAGLSIPEDMAIVGFGNNPMGEYLSPSLSTIDVYQRKLGTSGALRLLHLIEKRSRGEPVDEYYRLMFATTLIVRESSGAGLKREGKRNSA